MRPMMVFAALLIALLPVRQARAAEPVVVERYFPIGPTGRFDVDEGAGAVVIGQLLIQHLPTEAEVREADKPRDKTRPRPVLVVTNRGTSTASLDAKVTLEDGDGRVYMTCNVTEWLKKDATNELLRVYRRDQEMLTLDWPKVKVVHLVVRVPANL
jgi:hypothetical protein